MPHCKLRYTVHTCFQPSDLDDNACAKPGTPKKKANRTHIIKSSCPTRTGMMPYAQHGNSHISISTFSYLLDRIAVLCTCSGESKPLDSAYRMPYRNIEQRCSLNTVWRQKDLDSLSPIHGHCYIHTVCGKQGCIKMQERPDFLLKIY